MIDFHCHLDLYHDPKVVLTKIVEKRFYVLAVTTTPLAWEGTFQLVGSAPRVRVAAGLHPELVSTRYREVDRLCALIRTTRYVGEIGLDGSDSHKHSLQLQQQVLKKVLKSCESVGGRIMSIHSRGATSLVLDMLEVHSRAGIPVMHWFSGTKAELRRAIDLGCWFSLGPAMLRTSKGRSLASKIPTDRILTETDGPFARYGKIQLMPWDTNKALLTLSELWNVTESEVQKQLLNNLRTLVV